MMLADTSAPSAPSALAPQRYRVKSSGTGIEFDPTALANYKYPGPSTAHIIDPTSAIDSHSALDAGHEVASADSPSTASSCRRSLSSRWQQRRKGRWPVGIEVQSRRCASSRVASDRPETRPKCLRFFVSSMAFRERHVPAMR
jgi:hypothetical protein